MFYLVEFYGESLTLWDNFEAAEKSAYDRAKLQNENDRVVQPEIIQVDTGTRHYRFGALSATITSLQVRS